MNRQHHRMKRMEASPSYKIYHGKPRALTAEMLYRMNLPRDYWGANLDEVTEGKCKRYIKKYLMGIREALSRGYGLIINGQNGTGKSSVAALCLKQARRICATCFFITADEYLQALIHRETFNESMLVVDRCRAVDILVVDDLGKESVNMTRADGTAAMFEALVKDRRSTVRSTIITTNLSLAKVGELYGESMIKTQTGAVVGIHMTKGEKREKKREDVNKFFGL